MGVRTFAACQFRPEALVEARAGRRISVCLPARDEEATVGAIVAQVRTALVDAVPLVDEVLVVDDGSADGTAEVAGAAAARDGRLRLIRCLPHRGKGFAVRTGMLAARGDLVVFTDADGSYGPADVERIVAALADAPVAIGSRDLRRQATSAARQLASTSFNRAMRSVLELPFGDTQCGLKGFRRHAAQELFRRARIDGFAFDAEVLYLARRLDLRVAEVAVSAEERDGSKVRIAADALAMLGDALKVRRAAAAGIYDHGPPLALPPSAAEAQALESA